jgi:hypothetical protein
MRVPTNVPPPPGNRPRFASGRPNFASEDATIRSAPSSSSRPPPTAAPFGRAHHRDGGVALGKPVVGGHLRVVAAGGEGPQVHSRAERAVAGRREHQPPDLRVGLCPQQRRTDGAHHRAGQRVSRLRPIDPRGHHRARARDDQFVALVVLVSYGGTP